MYNCKKQDGENYSSQETVQDKDQEGIKTESDLRTYNPIDLKKIGLGSIAKFQENKSLNLYNSSDWAVKDFPNSDCSKGWSQCHMSWVIFGIKLQVIQNSDPSPSHPSEWKTLLTGDGDWTYMYMLNSLGGVHKSSYLPGLCIM